MAPKVAPREGAWIEISREAGKRSCSWVVPREGAWIEMWLARSFDETWNVAPCEGAWIETTDGPSNG